MGQLSESVFRAIIYASPPTCWTRDLRRRLALKDETKRHSCWRVRENMWVDVSCENKDHRTTTTTTTTIIITIIIISSSSSSSIHQPLIYFWRWTVSYRLESDWHKRTNAVKRKTSRWLSFDLRSKKTTLRLLVLELLTTKSTEKRRHLASEIRNCEHQNDGCWMFRMSQSIQLFVNVHINCRHSRESGRPTVAIFDRLQAVTVVRIVHYQTHGACVHCVGV